MADIKSIEQRSRNMSQIKGKDTSIEKKVRKYLFKRGFRYRKNYITLPGKPDLYLKKYKTVIFINGCFWHHHKNCKLAYMPKSNVDFWSIKFERNIKNDRKHARELRKMGYHVITVWECKLKKGLEKEMKRVTNLLDSYLKAGVE